MILFRSIKCSTFLYKRPKSTYKSHKYAQMVIKTVNTIHAIKILSNYPLVQTKDKTVLVIAKSVFMNPQKLVVHKNFF